VSCRLTVWSRLFPVAALLLCSGVLSSRLAAQSGEAPPIRAEVREVLVPVIVTDKKGHHVTGLKAADFRIEEDGVPQEITAFSTDTAPSAGLLLAARRTARRQPRPARLSPCATLT